MSDPKLVALELVKKPENVEEVGRLRQSLLHSTDAINKMRYDFLKELQLLREMVYRRENLGDDFEYMDVHFFSPTAEIDDKTCFVLNARLKEIVSEFNGRLGVLKKANDSLQHSIETYEKISADAPGLIAYHEMTAEVIVQKLAMVEDNARIIWQALDKQYGHAFFLDVIREEFGLIPKVNSEIAKQFNDKLFDYQRQARDQVGKLVDQYHKEITALKDEIKRKGDLIEEMNRKHVTELEEVRGEVEKAIKIKFRDQEDVMKTIFYSEKDSLQRRISDLENLVTELSNNRLTGKLRLRLAVLHKSCIASRRSASGPTRTCFEPFRKRTAWLTSSDRFARPPTSLARNIQSSWRRRPQTFGSARGRLSTTRIIFS